MTTLVSSLRNAWFADAPATRLATLRIVLGLFSLGYLIPRYSMYLTISRQDTDLFEPVGVVGWLTGPLPPVVFQGLLILTILTNGAFLLGWRYRFTGPLFGVLLLLTLCYRNSWSMIFHNDNILVLHALILGFVPAADAFSLDARRDRPVGSWLFGSTAGAGWQYGWPIKLMMAVATAPYVLSGIAKLTGPLGLDWMAGNLLRDQIAIDTLRKIVLGTGSSDAIYLLYNQSYLFLLFGLGTMLIELGAPLALVNRRMAYVWAFMAFLMHWGILFMMDITFRYQLMGAMFACYFPVERLSYWVINRLRPGTAATLTGPVRVASGSGEPGVSRASHRQLN